MPIDRIYRLKPEIIKTDRKASVALQVLRDYAPSNPAYSAANVAALEQALVQAIENETHAQNALNSARDAIVAAEWALHDAMLGVKAQAIAQYGPDSDVIQSFGLTKKSKRRRSIAGS